MKAKNEVENLEGSQAHGSTLYIFYFGIFLSFKTILKAKNIHLEKWAFIHTLLMKESAQALKM